MSKLDFAAKVASIQATLASIGPRVVACSGGIDSLLLATLAHRNNPKITRVVHAVSPAVPEEATTRLRVWAMLEGWNLEFVDSGEFDDEQYLSNPSNRCYFCKRHLYGSLHRLCQDTSDAVTFSGANVDDLGEYRPGLIAAAEKGVRHPWIESGFTKADIRMLARDMHLPFSELPASPCLASRLYTGTRVTASRLRAMEAGEAQIRRATSIKVVRCRLRENEVLIEVENADRIHVTKELISHVTATMRDIEPSIGRVALDEEAYRPGRSFKVVAA